MQPILRASATEFDVDSFVARFPQFPVDQVWRKGQARGRSGKTVYESSGLSASIADADTVGEVMQHLRNFVERWSLEVDHLRQHNVELTIDIGVQVDVSRFVSQYLNVSTVDLEYLAAQKIALEFSVCFFGVDSIET